MIEYLPKISVIIPIYNVERYLRCGLDSVLQQTYTNYEVILVNDGSTDSSRVICEEYIKKDPRFSLIDQENTGPSEARNAGIRMCKGEYVTFMDSDDWVEAGWLQAYIDVIKVSQPDFLVQGIIVDCGTESRKECTDEAYYNRKRIFDAFLFLEKRGIGGFACNKMYRTCLIKQQGVMFHYSLHEDLLFNMNYLCYVDSLVVIPAAYYHYVQHSGSLVTRRYHFGNMMQLNRSLRDARLHLADVFNRPEYRDTALSKYMEMYTILLFSLYDKFRGISDRKERLKLFRDYQHERREYKHLRLNLSGCARKLFLHWVMMPPVILDFLLNIVFTIKNRIRL